MAKKQANRFSLGVNLIGSERSRQIYHEGYNSEHDDAHVNGELVKAAIAYAREAARQTRSPGTVDINTPSAWPFEDEDWSPSFDPVRNLQKAGALIAAELDRLERIDEDLY